MTIATLEASVESWMERTFDTSLIIEWANDVADVLMRGVMAPDKRLWLSPPLRVRSMLTSTTLTTISGVATVPAACLEFERIWINATDGIDLTYIPLTQFRTDPDSQLTGTPTKYTMDGDNLYIAPTTDKTLQISYYSTLGAFTTTSSTDAIMTDHPGIYRAGVMAEACDWIGDTARADRERQKMYARVHALNGQEGRMQTSGSLLVARVGSVA